MDQIIYEELFKDAKKQILSDNIKFLLYVVQSKSNATGEIKQKLLIVHKNVFS